MKALTIREPWVSCILFHGKNIENRSWNPPTNLINQPIALHAAKHSPSKKEIELAERIYGIKLNLCPELRQRIVGIFQISKYGNNSTSKWAMADQIHWEIQVIELADFSSPINGQLGFWNIPKDIEMEITGAENLLDLGI